MKRLHFIAPAIIFAAFGLVGCSSTNDNSPDNTTDTPTVQPTSEPTKDSQDIVIDATDLESLKTIEGVSQADFDAVIATVRSFSEQTVTSPVFLSGAWQNMTIGDIMSVYQPFSDEVLYNELLALDPTNPDNITALYSAGAFFLPSEELNVPENCVVGEPGTNCLASDVKYSNSNAQYDANIGKVLVNTQVSTTRALIQDGEPVTSAITYTFQFWVDPVTHLVTGAYNDYNFGPIA